MTTSYIPKADRYEQMAYRRCGNSGLFLPIVSLGFWHNFGGEDIFENGRRMALKAFDLGITQFDLANNYGPPYGSAEETFGQIMKKDLKPFRDELVITTKAGWDMWPGPYGNFGSRKYLIASCDQSLKRMGLEYVDIFYHHRPDPETPLEETMMALDQIVRSGRALYVGISSYSADQTEKAIQVLESLGTPCLVHQPPYSMYNRRVESGLLDVLENHGVGAAVFSPLFQGVLSNRYLNGIPADSRAAGKSRFLNPKDLDENRIHQVQQLNQIALTRGQTMAQLALSWVLRDNRITSVIIGASKVSQIEEAAGIVNAPSLTEKELQAIEEILRSE